MKPLDRTEDRGLFIEEIRGLLNAPYELLSKNTAHAVHRAGKDALILKLLYDTWARVNELVNVKINDIDISSRVIQLRVTKGKTRRKGNGEYETTIEERGVDFSPDTKHLILQHLKGRTQGYLLPGRQGIDTHITTRAVRRMIYKYAEKIRIQRIVGQDKNGNPKYLIHPHSLREAGEMYAIIGGMDRVTAARKAGHSVEVQEKHYAKYHAVRARIEADLARERLGLKLGF